MKITNKQQEEIEFLIKLFKLKDVYLKDKENYILSTVLGKKKMSTGGLDSGETNKLFDAKRRLDMNIKMWREDLTNGLLSVNELKEDFDCEYGNRLVNSIIKSVTKDYRKDILSKGIYTVLSITNFLDNKI